MDLHFAPFDRAYEVTDLPPDLSVLMVGIAERQATSTTAIVQARLWRAIDPETQPLLLRPLHGAFNGPMAATSRGWPKT